MIVTHNISSMAEFGEIVRDNPGVVVMKIGAPWCGPCTHITPYIVEWFARLPEQNVRVIIVDVDQSAEFYAYMKRRKMLHGIPALFCYEKDNLTFVPDHFVVGTNHAEIDRFFAECISIAESVS
jgi:thiol-disulfide isomerase/thioredoxin